MDARFFTDIGRTRTRNEDAGGVFKNHTGQVLLLICDGMGGHNAGDVASSFVTARMKERFQEENYIEDHQAENWLKSNISDINRQLYQLAHQDDENQGMGTTIVAALLYDDKAVIANVGDSRAYFVNEREFRQVTNDHTFVNHLVMAGELSKEEAARHPQRHIITKVVGSDKRLHPDIFTYETKHYDKILLTSDGLTDYVDEQVIHHVFNEEGELETIGEKLIDLALSSDVNDNVSFVIGDFGGVR
ncbi:Stp1/IreP family PP2C-type Ser/Thr phosphatase [Macrococcus equipercicus]|uniref:protein-serine/threonine phosphatase n=1 Tax=Macrococcus equipercicus TaxID=69967 RepID=A0A9Q9BRZ1_9STAP|nr:Stp1/IreP family PP2C-type Ser/Thr phosphatase [Macrococcus equipercicus]KAA1042746.1 Stp1/IreP family PP2C-type Ser/Thr phosphatase [Macrococcus equipercicus]UTH14611.1 Stp1/IreP family PP2C-type Ser/Thr phosphatase [Macrococcus equipercicus]